jgi:hypothetical protein
MRADALMKTAGIFFLAFLAGCFFVGCRGHKAPEARSAPVPGEVTLDGLKSVLGVANDYASGVLDVTYGDHKPIVAYRYYDVDLQNYETDFASEMAPRVQALYKKFGTLDHIRFQITSNSPLTQGLWQPFTEFELDRKTVEEIHWTGFLARYLLDLVIKNKKS